MSVEIGQAVFSAIVDTSKVDSGLKEADTKVEAAAKNINAKMVAMSAAIGAAIGSAFGNYVQQALGELRKLADFFGTDAIRETAKYGEEMEHLGARMGMTAQQAAVLTGVFERHGVEAGTAARALTMMSMQVRQTQQALDPFSTRLGAMLGNLRDVNGKMLQMPEILDLVRQKINATSGDTEKLQMAQQLLGNRMGGQMLTALKGSNEEWEAQKKAVAESLGPVQEAAEAAMKYKEASVALDQSLKGLQLSIGTAVLPTLTRWDNELVQWIKDMKGGLNIIDDWISRHPALEQMADAIGNSIESQMPWERLKEFKKAIDTLQGVDNSGPSSVDQAAAEKTRADNLKKAADDELAANQANNAELAVTERKQAQLVTIANQRVSLAEKLFQKGGGNQTEVDAARAAKIVELEKQKIQLQQEYDGLQGTSAEVEEQQNAIREKQDKNSLDLINMSAEAITRKYQQEEQQAKALGLVNSSQEIAFIQEQLNDANLLYDTRLKLEGELFTKKQAYEEQAVKMARDLGYMQVQDEIKFRQNKTKDLLGRGDIMGAAAEMKKVQEMRLKEGDETMSLSKKIQIVAIQDEISFQKQKLELVRGNVAEERKIIESIADLDKALYDKRLEIAGNYVKSLSNVNKGILNASGVGESLTPEQAKEAEERTGTDAGRLARNVAEHGGTEEQRDRAFAWAQEIKKTMENLAATGKQADERQSAMWDNAKAIFGAFGVEARNIAGPSKEVGSALSATSIAASGLERGAQIPALDTGFADIAVRIRDVLMGTVPNIQNFADAIKTATAKISGTFGNPINTSPAPSGPGQAAQNPPPFGNGSSSTGQPNYRDLQSLSPDFAGSRPTSSPTDVPGLADLIKVQHDQFVETTKQFQDTLTKLSALVNKGGAQKVEIVMSDTAKEFITAISNEGVAEAIRK